MIERDRPTSFVEALDIARTVTDKRDDFVVYLDLARRIVTSRVDAELARVPGSEEHHQEFIEAEAYSMAQPAHLKDASIYRPDELISMLEQVGAISPAETIDHTS